MPDDPADSNQAPLADAGPDQRVVAGDRVILDGSASFDPDNDTLSYYWSQDDATVPVALQNAETAHASFDAPMVESTIELRFTLRVSDGAGESEDEAVIEVQPQIHAAAMGPTADAGPDQVVLSGSTVMLDAGASRAGGGAALSFEWVQVSGPGVSLTDPNNTTLTFLAPTAGGSPEELIFEVLVTEGDVTDADEVVIAVQPIAPAPPPQPPGGGGGTEPPPTDNCPNDLNKAEPGLCGCGVADTDSDGDGTPDCTDGCPNDPLKTTVGACGCGTADADGDSDGVPNCTDSCPNDPNKTAPGVCGCGVADIDSDGDGTLNCQDGCPNDSTKIAGGACGCGTSDSDRDGDGTPDCIDGCPDDPTTIDPADCAPVAGGSAQSDWDLVMLRMVNRARLDPSGEASRLGSSVVDSRTPVPPLAYDRQVGQAATNHNTWMHANLGGIASGRTPDSFSHYETVDGNSTGAPATSTVGFTGASLGQRITAAGFSWGSVGENILTGYSSIALPVNEAKIISNHKGWWESSGHRNNMLSASYTCFGHHIESRSFVPPLGGLNAPFDNLLFATQDFGRPQSNPKTHVFGVLYRDVDGNNAWTPRGVGAADREGLAGIAFTVKHAGTATVVASDTTMDNGAFSARVADGLYDITFSGSGLPGGTLTVTDITVSGANVDAGDVRVVAGP